MVILETKSWAQTTFGECKLGDPRRTKRLIKLAVQAAARPDGSTPEQTETWGDCKAADRESVVWGKLAVHVGPAPVGVKWVHGDHRVKGLLPTTPPQADRSSPQSDFVGDIHVEPARECQ